jgi:hypothetical protein
MSDINIYPFARKIVLEQKTEKEQKELLANANRDVDPLVIPADYTPVYTTDKPIAGVTDVIKTQKPTISVVETTSQVPVTPAAVAPKATSEHPFLGTFLATGLIVVSGYFLYKSLTKKK